MNKIDISKFRFSMPVSMRWSDLDEFGHVNNAVYLTYLEEGRVAYFANGIPWNWRTERFLLARAEVDFRAELKFTDKPRLYIRCAELGGSSFVFEYLIADESKERVYSTARSVQVMIDMDSGKSQPLSADIRQRFITFEGKENIEDKHAAKN
jgi:acyl-CoA thioester hydrolase